VELLRDPVLLIANPAARRGARLHGAVLQAFRAAGVRCDAVLTERPGHGAEIAARLAGDYQAVFTLGGDGTAMEVVGALAATTTPVGILAGGTGNLVARALGIPFRVDRAVPRLLSGTEAVLDLGVFHTGRRFAFAAGVGIDADMIRDTPASMKRRFGVVAYAYTAARAALLRRTFRVRVEVDGELIERSATAVMVANFGSVLNDLFVLGPGIAYDDGKLDLCVFSPGGVTDAVRVAWRLLRRDFGTDAALLYRPGHTFRITCDPPQIYQADGEILGTTPFEVRVEPLAARLLLPASTAALARAVR
jgi:diacylglycerol kinase (ATP)